VHGASSTPLLAQTIGQRLQLAAEQHGDREAVVSRHQSVRLTYEQLLSEAERLAASLLALGLERGDRVGIWSPNNVEWVLAQYATALAGLVLVNVNPAYRTHELEYALNKVGAKCLITARTFKTSHYVDMLHELMPEMERATNCHDLQSKAVPSLRTIVELADHNSGQGANIYTGSPALLEWDSLLEMGTPELVERVRSLSRVVQFDDAVNIQFTSGTTGAPKGATLSHHNILNNGFFAGQRMKFTPEDRVVLPVPLYHCMGCVLGNMATLTHGACIVYPSEGFDATASLDAVQEERATALYGVPTMFVDFVNHPQFAQYDLSSLRTGIMAGSPCPAALMRRVIDELNMRDVTIAYGMTETSPVSFQTGTDDPIDARVNTVGRIHPHVEVKIVDDAGAIVPVGATGELLTRGYSVMLGYWDDAQKTSESIDVGRWMHTGDLATVDGDGYCRIVGRVKDMVIRGGENIYPREVEEFLMHHPAVADVQVFGVPSERMGEELAAWIKLKPGQQVSVDDIRAYCREQIAHFKVPRYLRFVEEYPQTVSGKVQKFKMREAMEAEVEGGVYP